MSISSIFSGSSKNYDILNIINKPINTEHPHPLIFCFTPQRIKKGDDWPCYKCFLRYPHDTPSFHCTLCNYDLCQNCVGKYKLNQVKINKKNLNESQGSKIFKWQIKFQEHMHLLTLIQKRNLNYTWNCKKCSKEYKNKDLSFYCSLCDYSICSNCIGINNKISFDDIVNPSFQF